MNYIVKPLLPQIKPQQVISEAEYNEITNSRKLAWDILLVKELFSYVLRSFFELENKIKKIETEANNNRQKFKEEIRNGSFRLNHNHTLNLLTMNLLNTCHSYRDKFYYQNQNKNKEIFLGEDNIRKELEDILDKYYNKNIIYTFFTYLRNYGQHHDSIIKGVPVEINNRDIKIGFTVNVSKILKQSDEEQEFKKYLETESSIYCKQELQNYPKKLNIRPLIKEYISIIKDIHKEFDTKLNLKFKESKNIISQKVKYYCQDSSQESAFEIFNKNEETQELEEKFDVSLKLINDWEKTIEKYTYPNQINN